jgi:glycosyltransferase involved in cell wall biosynthesis
VRIGIVSQWYRPEPAIITGDVADGLVARGHDVRVLTGFPNYPDGAIYPGFRQRWGERSQELGITLRRVPLYASHDASGLKRAANYLSFAATSSVAAVRFLKDVDVVYVYLTPATVYAAPALLRRLRGIPAVIHVQDIWPESVTASSMAPQGGAGRLVDRTLHAMMRRIYRSASAVAVIAPSMRDLVIERGAADHQVRTILNWTDESLFRPVKATDQAKQEIGHRDRCTIMYAGAMGAFQNIEASVRAAASLNDEGEVDVDLVLAGSGTQEKAARDLADELGATNVRFLGRKPLAEMATLYGAADYQLVTLRDLPIFRGTIPSKLPAALACGLPVIVSVPGDCAALVEDNGVGFACPPDDWRVLAERFRQAAKLPADEHRQMADRARTVYQAQMSRRAGVDQLESLLIEAAVNRKGTS